MDISAIFLQNRLLIHTIYLVIVVFCSLMIFFKFKKLYGMSTYEGFKHFSNAFLFYAMGLFITYAGDWLPIFFNIGTVIPIIIKLLIEYSLLMGGFFLVYSLLWKKLEDTYSGFPIDRVLLLHAVAVFIALIDYFQTTGYIMYIVLLVITIYGCFITYNNYVVSRKGFKGLFFLAMVLNLIGWIAYFVAFFVFPFFPAILLYIYVITATIFIIFLYGVLKVK